MLWILFVGAVAGIIARMLAPGPITRPASS